MTDSKDCALEKGRFRCEKSPLFGAWAACLSALAKSQRGRPEASGGTRNLF
jgi:hypothetical protein